MGKTYDVLDERLIKFIEAQKMFFVATAPLTADGHVNLSPKGYDAFKVIDETTVAYLDLGGSGIETRWLMKQLRLPRFRRVRHRNTGACSGKWPHHYHVLRL